MKYWPQKGRMANHKPSRAGYTWRMYNESTVQMFMNTYRVSTAPKCPQCGSSPVREASLAELSSMKCDACSAAIPPQAAADAAFSLPFMHLFGDENVAAGMEAIRRSGL
jgi:uncharacterized protein (DUF983 family)